jgi:hypothetical protein
VTIGTEPAPGPPAPVVRPAYAARMLALAHHIEAAIADGEFPSRNVAARCHELTSARFAQLLSLLALAPDIQEEVLGLQAVDGKQPATLRVLERVAREVGWGAQRVAWRQIVAAWSGDPPPPLPRDPAGSDPP